MPLLCLYILMHLFPYASLHGNTLIQLSPSGLVYNLYCIAASHFFFTSIPLKNQQINVVTLRTEAGRALRPSEIIKRCRKQRPSLC